jgi:hypothetical protein
VNSFDATQDELFPWRLSQERIDLIAEILYKLETILNVAESGGRTAEQTACLLTDLREQCCQLAGAADPFPDMPLFPHFENEESSATKGSAT